jgi:hypothetical protein
VGQDGVGINMSGFNGIYASEQLTSMGLGTGPGRLKVDRMQRTQTHLSGAASDAISEEPALGAPWRYLQVQIAPVRVAASLLRVPDEEGAETVN